MQHCLADVGEVGSFPVVESALAACEGEEGFDEVFLLVVGGEELLRRCIARLSALVPGSSSATCRRLRSAVRGVRSS